MKLTRRTLVRVAVAASAGVLVPNTVQAAPAGLSFVPVTPPQVGHAEHVCYCQVCRPDVYPLLPKQGANHVAIRFGDTHWRGWLNGVEVEGLTEMLAGERGYVIYRPKDIGAGYVDAKTGLLTPAIHVCGFKRVPHREMDACMHVAYGRVEIQRMDGH